MLKLRLITYVLVIGAGVLWFGAPNLMHEKHTPDMTRAGKGISSYDLPMPLVMPAAAYEAN